MTADRRAEAERIADEIMRKHGGMGLGAIAEIERALIAERNATLEEAARAVENDCGIGIQHGDKIRALRTDAGTDAGEETGT